MRPPPASLVAGPLGSTIRAFARAVGFAVSGEPVELFSWFRTPEVNAAEGGEPESQHLYGLAFDIIGPIGALTRVERAIWMGDAAGGVPIMESDHLHVQRFPSGVLAACGFVFPPPPFP